MEEPSSKQLIARCAEGDPHARTLLVKRYHTRLLELAHRGAGSRRQQIEPESIVNEVFLRFLQLADSGRLEWQFEGGLWRLLSRMTALRIKEKQREILDPRKTARGGSQSLNKHELVSELSEEHALAEVLDEFREILQGYRQQLTDERRVIFDLWLDGLSSIEIGNEVGSSDRNVRRNLEKIRGELNDLMNARFG